jgi:EcsC protein family
VTDQFSAEFTESDLADLRVAKQILLSPSLTAKLGNLIGKPLEKGLKLLPKNWNQKVADATETALYKALQLSASTMGSGRARPSRDWLHKAIVVTSGVAAGAAGFYSVIIELPFSTVVMLRSIADIARSEGFDVSLVDTRLACLEVFALGGGGMSSEAAETGYWGIRGALAVTIREAASHIAERGLADRAAPPIVRLVAGVASRFGGVVTAEAAALAIPVIGAVSGGAVNYMFIDHFQDLARAHFIIKRLENDHGPGAVRAAYDALQV